LTVHKNRKNPIFKNNFFTRMHVCPFQGDECFGILCSSQPRERGKKRDKNPQ
jgi:hypothetical protein